MRLLLGLVAGLAWLVTPVAAETFLVEQGEPRAQIVVAEQPQRAVRLAAQELQDYVKKITGAHLPIVTEPEPGQVPIYVGRSQHTDRLNITAEGLTEGAYRIVSTDQYLVLIGDDTEFMPIEPWARNNAGITSGKLQQEWEAIAGEPWGVPNRTLYKNRMRLPGGTGLPDAQRAAAKNAPPLELWTYDERGSFNAVCGFLRKLGVRWYAPGELGEVLPDIDTIALPKLDETVKPDFAIRRINVRLATHTRNVGMWVMRLGMRDPYGIAVAHGMATMTGRDEIFARHPDWFAMYAGQRRYIPGSSKNHLCYSNEELLQQTVRWVRAQLDHYKLKSVSVMPPDGYTAICQCPKCEGQARPDREQRGMASDHIWEFVNRVAKEVRKTHPNAKILNCAYGIYWLPPEKIDRLEPNVVVSIVGGRRPLADRPEEKAELARWRKAWAAKTHNPIIIFENYPFTDRGWYLPAYAWRSIGEGINATKGISEGEDIWLSAPLDFETNGIGFNHFLVYFTQRMYWGGKQQDADALFREYCRQFFGPAEHEIAAFFTFCQANWRAMENDKALADEALRLFDHAKAKVEAESVYGQRLAWIDDFLKGLRSKSEQLGRKRGPVPVLRLVGEPRQPIKIDGKLDDDAWVNAFPSATCQLRELQTGRTPTLGTVAKATWRGNDLYIAIRCDEKPNDPPVVGTTEDDDSAMWYGDCVEVLLETNAHRYYQIAVNPAGAVADLDRGAAKNAWFSWDSEAEVATHVADDHWTVEMRIPITQDENDPLHQVIGRKPTQSLPWFINICRQRVRDDQQELSAFSPTAAGNFHDVMKFGYFYSGRSHQFEADEPENDFIHTIRKADQLARNGQRTQAMAMYAAAAQGDRRTRTDVQRSHALALAAATAQYLGDLEAADRYAEAIPIEAVKQTVQMQHLLARREPAQVVEQFSAVDINTWPFWQRGEGYFARGRAYAATGDAERAEAEFKAALQWVSERRVRDDVWLALAQNRQHSLNDTTGAIEAYQAIIADKSSVGGATEFRAIQMLAQLHTRQGQADKALAVLGRANIEKLQGYWFETLQLQRGDALVAAGRSEEAIAAYRSVTERQQSSQRSRDTALERIQSLKQNP